MLFRSMEIRPRLSAAIILLLPLAACSRGPGDVPSSPAVIADHGVLRVPAQSPLRTRLKIQSIELRDMAHALVAPAVVEADPARTLNILPPLTGRIVELKVGLGDRVMRGQLLAVIASGDFAQAHADAAKARDALALAKKTLQRAEGVQAAGGAAQKDLEAAHSGYVQAQTEFDRAQDRLAALGDTSPHENGAHRINITAPIAGSVTALAAAVGAFVNDSTAALMTVTNIDSVWITANVAENEAGQIAAGQPVEATLPAYPGRVFRGSVQSVGAMLDADSRRLKARIALANADGALKPNMFATVTFKLPQPKALFVPQSALLMNNDSVSVFVETSPWTFMRRIVVLGDDEGGDTRIVSGLKPGERVVVAGGVLIND